MTGLEDALTALGQALDAPRRHHMWRWLVRHRMAGLKEALGREHSRAADSWLAAREVALARERDAIIRELARLGPLVLDASDVEPVRRQLKRLLADVERHRQRLNDLVYDTVTLELGGEQ